MKSDSGELEAAFRERIRRLRFFDANCWLGRPNAAGPVYLHGVAELQETLMRCGIERAIVSHCLARFSHPRVGNEMLIEELGKARAEPKLTGSFVLLPDGTDELGNLDRYIEAMLGEGVRTVRLFPKSHNFSLADWCSGRLLSRLEERRIPLFIWPRETDWDSLYGVASRHPRLPLVLEQCEEEAYWNLRFVVPLLARCPNVFVETDKAHLYLGVDEIVRRFGPGRLIFGSHLPVDDPFASLMLVTDGDFPEEGKGGIAHANLEALLNGVNT